jgi:hypothetical protein
MSALWSEFAFLSWKDLQHLTPLPAQVRAKKLGELDYDPEKNKLSAKTVGHKEAMNRRLDGLVPLS